MSVYPPGVKVTRSATISDDGRYRYSLGRSWATLDDTPRYLFYVMLNPSTADASRDDATILRCVGLARVHGYTGIHVMNLFALRATKPVDLWRQMDAGVDVVGPENDLGLRSLFLLAHELERPVVAAWGAAPKARKRIAEVCAMPYADTFHAFRLTASGMPWHPLYLPTECELTPWKIPA